MNFPRGAVFTAPWWEILQTGTFGPRLSYFAHAQENLAQFREKDGNAASFNRSGMPLPINSEHFIKIGALRSEALEVSRKKNNSKNTKIANI